MKIYTFTTRSSGQNIYASHINDIQTAINELSTELSNGIGSVVGAGGGKTFKLAAATASPSMASLNIPTGAQPNTPAQGDVWFVTNAIYYYTGSAVRTLATLESPTFTGTVTLPATTSIGTVSSTELGYVDGVTSSIQTQLNGKAATSHTHAISDVTNLQTSLDGKLSTTITAAASGEYIRYSGTAWVDSTIQAGDLPTGIDAAKLANGTVSNTEFQYLDGVTSAIQTQLNGKAATSHTHAIADVTSLQTTLDGKLNATITAAATGEYIRYNGTAWVDAVIAAGDLPANISATKLADGTVDNTEFQYLNGVTSAIQTQLDGKAASSHTHTIANVTSLQTTLDSKLTATITAAAAGKYIRHNGTAWVDAVIAAGDLPTGIDAAKLADGSVSNTEFQYLDGVTSSIQTQLNGKAATSHTHAISDVTSLQTTLNGKLDATITSAATGNYIRYNGTSWVNTPIQASDISGALTNITNLTISGNAVLGNASGNTVTVNAGTVTMPANSLNVTAINNANVQTLATDGTAKTEVRTGGVSTTPGTLVGTRSKLNLVQGNNIALTVTDNATTGAVDISIASTASGTVTGPTGAADNELVLYSTSASDTVIKRSNTFQGIPKLTNGVVSSNAGLGDLSGVTISSAASAQVLRFNGTNWANTALAASDIASGTFAFARMPVGTTSTTVSQGDHTHTLSQLSNVSTATPSDGQMLKYSSATSKWEPVDNIASISLVFGDSINGVATGYQSASVMAPYDCTAYEWWAWTVGDTAVTAPNLTFRVVAVPPANYPGVATNPVYLIGTASTQATFNVVASTTANSISNVAIPANSIIRVNVIGITTAPKVLAIQIRVRRTA